MTKRPLAEERHAPLTAAIRHGRMARLLGRKQAWLSDRSEDMIQR